MSHDASRQIAWLRAGLARFHRADRGATLTEFIIILPVFLIIFSAILKLTLLQSTTVQLKISATKALWNKALRRPPSPVPGRRYVKPETAGRMAKQDVDEPNVDRSFSDRIDRAKFDTLQPNGSTRGGTIGESEAALRTPGNGELEAAAKLDLPPSVNGVTDDVGNVLRRQDRNYETGGASSMFSARLVNDTQSLNNPPSLPAPAQQMEVRNPPQSGASNAAYVAGVRYGLAQVSKNAGDSSNAADALDQIPFVDADQLETGYDTLVAPRPRVRRGPGYTEHYRPVGITRRYMGDYGFHHYSGIDESQP